MTNSVYGGQTGNEKKLNLSEFKTIGNKNIYKPYTQPLENTFFSKPTWSITKLATYQVIRQILIIQIICVKEIIGNNTEVPFQ